MNKCWKGSSHAAGNANSDRNRDSITASVEDVASAVTAAGHTKLTHRQ